MPRSPKKPIKSIAPANTPEARESQMIAYAIDLAEEQLRNGTASSQIITHYLKLATERERLERENLRSEIEYKREKTRLAQAQQNMEKMYTDAIAAMRDYAMPRYDDVD